jgi:hypothetical protein
MALLSFSGVILIVIPSIFTRFIHVYQLAGDVRVCLHQKPMTLFLILSSGHTWSDREAVATPVGNLAAGQSWVGLKIGFMN